MNKTRRCYMLYHSTQSKWYSNPSKALYVVAAYSAKQACFLARRWEWYTGKGVGLLAYSGYASDTPFKLWDGTENRHQHGGFPTMRSSMIWKKNRLTLS
jgi:hypothetical protein